jgi:SAM-dependent methyltransferase
VFDCVILTQTLIVVPDFRQAVWTLRRILAPGGVLLVTFPGLAQISRYDMDRWGDYWRFTDLSARKMFAEVFGAGNIQVATHGNVLAAIGLLQGLCVEDLSEAELDHFDPDYQVTITMRAVKREEGDASPKQPGIPATEEN